MNCSNVWNLFSVGITVWTQRYGTQMQQPGQAEKWLFKRFNSQKPTWKHHKEQYTWKNWEIWQSYSVGIHAMPSAWGDNYKQTML